MTLLFSAVPAFAGPLDDRVSALEAQVADLLITVGNQQTAINELASRLAAVEGNGALALGSYVSVNSNELNGTVGPHVIFEGVNLHLRNGVGHTMGWLPGGNNGLGNLIIGYNEIAENEQDPFLPGDRGGSHNLVVGSQTKFTSTAWGGIVQGEGNKIAHRAVAIAGNSNSSNGECDVVIGGAGNYVSGSGAGSTILGAVRSRVEGGESTVICGGDHTVYASQSTILGGRNNFINPVTDPETGTGTQYATVVGGYGNTAPGIYATAAGGEGNLATGRFSLVSGGFERSALGDHDWAAGSLWENY